MKTIDRPAFESRVPGGQLKKRVLNVVGVTVFLAAGSHLCASELAPFSSDDSASGASIAAPSTTGIGDSVFDEEDGEASDANAIVTEQGLSGFAAVGSSDLTAGSPVSSNSAVVAPEPAPVALLLVGAAGVGFGSLRRRLRR